MDNLKLKLRLRVGSFKNKSRPSSLIFTKEKLRQADSDSKIRYSGEDPRMRYSGSDPRIYHRTYGDKRNTWWCNGNRERTHR